jgi:6-phosphogluconolactonase (cycloisomerase 2 family)
VLSITTASPLPNGTVGSGYSQTLAATGGTPPYGWSVTAGTLPAGLTLSSGGVLSGTPTASGTSNFTVQAADSGTQTTTKGFALTINGGAPPPLSITTASPLPNGTVGTAYSQTLAATGGTPPYAWTVVSGTPPAGLTLSTGGVLSGTPTGSGTSNFTVQAADSGTQTATKGFALTINGAAPPTGQLTQLSGTAGCISETGTGGSCAGGRGLDGAGWFALSPDGTYGYLAAFDSSTVTTYARNGTTGQLTQLAGTAGCVAEFGDNVNCADGRGLFGAVALAVSPDGNHVYVASRSNTVAAFARNGATGVLTQLSGTGGCIAESGDGVTCADGNALVGLRGIAISPDGKSVYVTARDGNAVAIFARNATTGVLTQLGGTAGCVSSDGTGGTCAVGRGLLGARGVMVSADNLNVYIGAQNSSAVAVFSRNATTGALTQLGGTAGCIAESGDGVTCADGRGLGAPIHLEGSADGKNVYVSSGGTSSLAVFSRNATTGALTQLAGAAGCIAESGDGVNCADGKGLNEVVWVTVSPDGANVYAAAQASHAVTAFARDAGTGGLTQLSGTSA